MRARYGDALWSGGHRLISTWTISPSLAYRAWHLALPRTEKNAYRLFVTCALVNFCQAQETAGVIASVCGRAEGGQNGGRNRFQSPRLAWDATVPEYRKYSTKNEGLFRASLRNGT